MVMIRSCSNKTEFRSVQLSLTGKECKHIKLTKNTNECYAIIIKFSLCDYKYVIWYGKG